MFRSTAFSLLALSLLPLPSARGNPGETDLEILKNRVVASLLPRGPREKKTLLRKAHRILRSLREDGTWKDVDYASRNRSAWRAAKHLDRCLLLARAARLSGSRVYARAALASLRFWLKKDPRNPNWWWNEIGVPRRIGETALLLQKRLEPGDTKKVLEILRRSRWKGWTGQNLVWGVTIQVLRGLLEGSAGTAGRAFRRMYREIRIVGPAREGIQADMSFHQHGRVLYSGGYGAGFTADAGRFLSFARGTAFAAPREKTDLLLSYVLDGQRWMIRGAYWDYGVMGREISRAGRNALGILPGLKALEPLAGKRLPELRAMEARLLGDEKAPPFAGNKHFWCSDYMAHHRPGFFASVRMFSTRVDNTDWPCNREGLKSHHLADGANLLYLRGDEYKDVFPCWDWKKIPGTTVEQEPGPLKPDPALIRTRGKTSFVGGVSDGRHGLAAMDLFRGKLRARKTWFFFDRGYLCAGAGITCPTGNPAATTVNQCLLSGPVTARGSAAPLPGGTRLLHGPAWVRHHGVLYLFPRPCSLHLENRVRRGRWSDIGTGSSKEVRLPVFTLWIDHGKNPAGASYSYLVLPGAGRGKEDSLLRNPPAEVLSSDPDLMAFRWKNVTAAAFFRPGRVEAGSPAFAVDQPCLALLVQRKGALEISLSNPRNAPLQVRVEVFRPFACRALFQLPGGLEAGKTVIRVLERGNRPAPIREKGRIEGAKLKVSKAGGGLKARVRKVRSGGKAPVTGKRILFLQARGPCAWAEFPLPGKIRPGLYKVRLFLLASRDYGKTRWSLDGMPLLGEFDGYAPSIRRKVFSGGPIRLGKGKHFLKFVVTGKNPLSTGYHTGLEAVALEPVKKSGIARTPTPADLPRPDEFTPLVLKILKSYPADGTHGYFWPRGNPVKGWAGNTMDLYYQGKLFSPGDPKGRCYCCGLTFEVFFRAWKAWCEKKKKPFRVDGLDFEQLKSFRAHFFGSNGDLKCVGGAIPAWGLGFAVPPMEARPGDFVQFWRHPRKGRRASGHSVIFLAWVKGRGGKPKALRYWSTQGSTKGIGIREERVGGPGGVDLSRVYAARVGLPPF